MKIPIKYLDGERFKRSIIASVQNLLKAEKHLNEINVFPVPDGDTGTNMAATMRTVAEGAEACEDKSIEGVSNAIADSALNGSRGNSGAIMAQFFQGLAEATRGKARLTTQSFASAVNEAVVKAKQAMANPREGTIITVMHEWADAVARYAEHTHDFSELFKKSLHEARQSLADTPNKLKELKMAGVVDAGAEGFVHLLEGVSDFISKGKVAAFKAGNFVQDKIRGMHMTKSTREIKFRYCTECLIEGEAIDRIDLRQELDTFGDSLLVVGSDRKVRIHIHTNEPQKVFDLAATFGTVVRTKMDDMQDQHSEAMHSELQSHIAIVTDSTCDLPPEVVSRYNIHVVPVVVQVGDQSYLDRTELSAEDFFQLLQQGDQKLLTSQPSPAQFKEIYNKLGAIYGSVLSLHIARKLSGSIQAAHLGRGVCDHPEKITVMDSCVTTAALGLIVAAAAKWVEQGFDAQTLQGKISTAIKQVRLYVNLPTLKYVIRSGRLSKTRGLVATALNVKPVLTLDSEGALVEAAKTVGKKNGYRKTLDLAIAAARGMKDPVFNIAHARAWDLVNWYMGKIRSVFPDAGILVSEASPALTLHVGIGGSAIAVLGDAG